MVILWRHSIPPNNEGTTYVNELIRDNHDKNYDVNRYVSSVGRQELDRGKK